MVVGNLYEMKLERAGVSYVGHYRPFLGVWTLFEVSRGNFQEGFKQERNSLLCR